MKITFDRFDVFYACVKYAHEAYGISDNPEDVEVVFEYENENDPMSEVSGVSIRIIGAGEK